MQSSQELYNQLAYYTLSHPDPSFIHQHIVDAYTAQVANGKTKPIAITFALAGLYLYLEKGFTGKQVQHMHMHMAKKKRAWPLFDLPQQTGDITVADVLATPAGKTRDEKIHQWCIAVWNAYQDSHAKIANLLDKYLF